VKRILFLFIIGVMCWPLMPTPARACDGAIGELIGSLLTPIIEDIDNPDIKAAINFVLPRIQNDLGTLLTNAKFKDDRELRAYLESKGETALADWIIEKGGWKWLWREIDRISPRLAEMIYREVDGVPRGILPRALVELQRQGRIPEATLSNLLVLRPFNLTASEEDWLAMVAAEEWAAVKREGAQGEQDGVLP